MLNILLGFDGQVSSSETDVISFRLHQKFKVGHLQPSTVTVYQYYNKGTHKLQT